MNRQIISLGWTLLHFIWEAAIIALFYKSSDLFSGRLRSQSQYVLGLIAQLAMGAAGLLTFTYEEAGPSSLPGFGLAHFTATVFDTRSFLPGSAMAKLFPWLDGFWLLGVAVLCLRATGGWWFLHRLARTDQCSTPVNVLLRFEQIVRRLGIRGTVKLRMAPGILSPFAVGCLRSLVYLPASALTSLSPEQLDAVLAHEVEHIRRADYFWNMVQTAVETLFFFHPAVWWIGSRVREQRELCCDDVALRFTSQPWVYASALATLEENRSSQLLLTMPLCDKSGLLRRTARILGVPCETAAPSTRWLLTLTLCFAAMSYFFTLQMSATQLAIAPKPVTQAQGQVALPNGSQEFQQDQPASNRRPKTFLVAAPQVQTSTIAGFRPNPYPHQRPDPHSDPHPNPHPDPHPRPHPDSVAEAYL
jgi:beta-lactamase regulating signal transducer with metallopeptidase domain